MPSAVALGEELADDGFAGEGRKGDGGDELFAGRSDDDLYFCSSLDDLAYDEA